MTTYYDGIKFQTQIIGVQNKLNDLYKLKK